MKRITPTLAALALLCTVPAGRAADGSWSNDASGIWSVVLNWEAGIVAGGTDGTAFFTNTISAPCVVTNDLGTNLLGGFVFASTGTNGWSVNGGQLQFSTTAGQSLLSVAPGSASIGSQLSGTGTVVKAGAGSLTLGGGEIYSGATVISNGVLKLGGGSATVSGFGVTGADWVVNNTVVATPPFDNDVLTLTDTVAANEARTAFLATRLPFFGGFTAKFTYWETNAPGNRADGMTFMLQNDSRGTAAKGATGGAMGYGGITQSVAIALNIYSANTVGTKLFSNGTSGGPYTAVTPVNLVGANPVDVTISYSAAAQSLTEFLAEQNTTNTYSVTYANVNVPALLGGLPYVGFSGGTGGQIASQLVSNFSFTWSNSLPALSPVSIAPGATLDLNGTFQTIASLADNNGGGGSVTNSAAVPASIGFAPVSGSTTFSGVIADAGVTNTAVSVVMLGKGTQILSGNNTYRGPTIIDGGTLSVAADANLGSTNSLLTIYGYGVLQVTSSFTNKPGRLVSMAGAGTIDVGPGATYGIANGFTTSGNGLTKSGTGTVAINQTAGANNWTGPLTVNTGSVLVQGTVSDGSLRGNITINNGGTLRLASSNLIANTSVITVNAGGVFDLSSFAEAIGYLSGAGTVTNTSGGLTLDLGAASQTFSGSIGGTGQILVRGANGAGTQVFGGSNTFSGGLVLQNGTVSVGLDSGLGAAGGTITFSGGTLQVTGATLTNLDSRTVNWSGFSGGFDIAATNNIFTITNVISGTGALTKSGLGTLVLASTNLRTGVTTVNAGTLDIGVNGSIASTFIAVNTNATLLLESDTALATNASVNLLANGTNFARLYLSNAVAMTIGSFAINGVSQSIGTWGGAGSGATFINTNLFAGSGVLNVTAGLTVSPSDGSWGVDANGEWGFAPNWVGSVIAIGTNSTAYFTNTITADRSVNNSYTSTDIGNLAFASLTNNWSVTNNAFNLIVNAGVPTITVASNTATVGSILKGSQGLTKAGAGTLLLTASEIFTGPATVDKGTLQLSGQGSMFSAGSSPGTIAVNSNGTLAFARNDTFGLHASASPVVVAVNQGGLISNSNNFNTLNNLVLNGGELRANGGASVTFQSYQLKGTVTVSGASASLISATTAVNLNNQIQIGNNATNGTTVFAVSDATGDANPDLVVGAGFIDGRNTGSSATVASGFHKTGPGSMRIGGNNLNSGTNIVGAGVLIAAGGALNSPVTLTNGTTLVAVSGPGLLGEFFIPGATPLVQNFTMPSALSAHLGTLNPALIYNFPVGSTNFDYNDAPVNWPAFGATLNFEARWTGRFIAPSNGLYTFSTQSDDGSMLWIDGALVVNNNAFQGGIAPSNGVANLSAGPHEIALAYYQGTGGYRVFANVALPGGATNRISNGLVSSGPGIGALNGEAGTMVFISNTVLTVSQAANSQFDGAITTTGSAALRKIGQGTLTLTAANSMTNTILGGGRVSIANDSQVGGATSGLTFDGGLLQVTGMTITNIRTHTVNWPTFVGGFDIANAANVFTITNNIGAAAANSSLWKSGPGSLPMIGNTNVLNSGFVVNNGLLIAQDAAIVNYSNAVDAVGNVAGDFGRLALQGSSMLVRSQGSLLVGNGSGSRGTISIEDNTKVVNSGGAFYVGNISGSAGALYQSGGSVANAADLNIPRNAGAYGFFRKTSGGFTNSNWTQVGGGGLGLYYQFGGSHAQVGNSLISGNAMGGSGTGVVYIAGGTETNANNLVPGWAAGTRNEWTISGGSVLAPNVQMNNATNVAILNLNGGTLQIASIFKQTVGATSTLNFNGGKLQARVSGNLIGIATQAVDNAYIFGGGATVDSSVGYNVTIAQNLLTPPGSGVTVIPLTTGGAGYIGAPYVQITGGGGTGATAVALIDVATNSLTFGQVTNILLTCPGVNYASAPAVALVGGGFTLAATLGSPTTGANVSGGLNIMGGGSLALFGTNTYGGVTIISNGVLLVGSTNALGSSSLIVATNSAGIGPTYALDQDFVNWLTTKLAGATSPGIIALGADSGNSVDLSGLTNWSFGSAGGTYSFNGPLTIASTNLYLGGGNGTLIYAPNIGTGTNVFIGFNGGSPVVQLNGTNTGYASTMNIVSGTLKGGVTNCLGSIAATVNITNGTTLDVNGTRLGPAHIYVQGAGVSGNGAIINSGSDHFTPVQNIHLTGDTTFGGTGRWDINNIASAGFLDLNGFTLTKTNANTIDVWVSNVSDGNIIIGQGILRFESNGSMTGGVGTVTVGPSGNLNFWNLAAPATRPVTMQGGIMSVFSGTANIGSPVTLSGGYSNRFDASVATRLVLTGLVSGSGNFIKTGAGSVVLPDTKTFNGPTIATGGILELSASNAANGTIGFSSALTVNGGTVNVDFTDGLFGTNAPPLTIAVGMVTSSNGAANHLAGPLTLSGGTLAGGTPDATLGNWIIDTTNVSVTAGSQIAASRVQLGAVAGVTFDVTNGAVLGVNASLEDPGLGTFGTGILIKAGSGLMALGATNTYRGDTIINAGTLKLGGSLLSGFGGNGAGWQVNNFTISGQAITNDVLVLTDNVGNEARSAFSTTKQPVLGFTAKFTYTPSGNKAADGFAFVLQNNVPTSLGAAGGGMGYSGIANSVAIGFNIYAPNTVGTKFGSGGALGAPYTPVTPVILGSGNPINVTLAYDATANTITQTLAEQNTANTSTMIYTNVNLTTALGGTSAYVGFSGGTGGQVAYQVISNFSYSASQPVDLVLPTNTVVRIASVATLDLSGISQMVGALADKNGGGGSVTNPLSPLTLTIGSGDASGIFSGTISDGAGTIALVKNGTGTQTLHGINGYSGDTTISDGTLIVNGAISSTNQVIMTGGTLGGTGVVGGLILQFGGTVAPGASPGILTFRGSYAQLGTLAIEIAGTTPGSGYDRLVVGDSASLSGPLIVATNGYAPVAGDSFTIITASNGMNGFFSSTNLPALSSPATGWKIEYQPNAVVLSVTGAPPAATGYDLAVLVITNGLTGYQDDADGDGYANLLEYVTGGNLTNADTIARMQGTRIGGLLALQFTRASNSVDTILVVEGANASTNNANWIGIATNLGGSWGSATNVVETNGPSLFNVTAFDSSPATNRFLRLRVTRP